MLIMAKEYPASIRAITYCDLLRLDRHCFEKALTKFPDYKEIMIHQMKHHLGPEHVTGIWILLLCSRFDFNRVDRGSSMEDALPKKNALSTKGFEPQSSPCSLPRLTAKVLDAKMPPRNMRRPADGRADC